MIQSAATIPASNQLTDKSTANVLDPKAAESFLEILTAFKNEEEQQGEHDHEQELVSFITAMLTQITKPKSAQAESQQLQIVKYQGEITKQIPSVEGKIQDLLKSLNSQEMAKLVKFVNSFSEGSLPKGIKDIRAFFSFQTTQVNHPAPFLPVEKYVPKEQSFEFLTQPEGKEFMFQPFQRAAAIPGQPQVHEQSHLQRQVPVDDFVFEVMELLKSQAEVKKASDIIEAKFSLTPERLGDIQVRLTIEKGQIIAQFLTNTTFGKEALESQVALLRNSLEMQGFQIDKIEISQNRQEMHHGFSQQDGKSQQGHAQQQQAKKKHSQDDFYQSHHSIDDVMQKGSESTINLLA